MYEFIQDFIGVLPTEFEFVYTILTIGFSLLILSFLMNLFYIPLKFLGGR